MNSIEKLKRLTGENIPKGRIGEAERIHPSSPSKKAEIDELRHRIETVINRKPQQPKTSTSGKNNLAEIVSGEEIENDHGRFFLVSEVVRGSSRHGHRNIRETFDFDIKAAAILANNPDIGELSSSDALFLDTETTGLAGGTGTMAFLIGLGWFEDGHFHVRQILARDFSEEAAALVHLAEIANKKKFLITFNGKAFDVNLLTTRFILNRLRSDLSILPHLDLLHPSRRILGHRLENSRLVTLEAEVLGVQREDDIPGWEIPQRYFDWLRKRDGHLLAAIFEHNRLDVISMASLTAHLTEILTAHEFIQNSDAGDYLAAARLLLKRRGPDGAEKILSMFQKQSCAEFSYISKKQLSHLYKRTGRWREAVQIWEEIAATSPTDFSAISELAKWLEHHVRDYRRAQVLIEKALDQEHAFSTEERESLLHRLRRLNDKLKTAR
jgi:uncharacterized protein YprB with RNaseH-like and TPR domain